MQKIRSFYQTHAGKLATWLTLIALALLALHFCLQGLNWLVYHQQNGSVYELTNRFDLDDEASVTTWFSQGLFLLLSFLALLAGYFDKNTKAKRLWWLIGLGALLASIDEVAGLHEFGLQTIHNLFFVDQAPTALANAWLMILPIILIIAGWLIREMLKTFSKNTVILFALAIGVFLTGAVGIDQITSLTERESFVHQGVLVGLEEALELVSVVVLIYAVAKHLEDNYETKIKKAIEVLK